MEFFVLFQEAAGIGWITLNRPKALNALNASMVDAIEKQLAAWKDDPAISLVCIEGAGEKGLCAGGDMRSFYDEKDGDIDQHALDFFATEYRMNHALDTFPKPILVYMDGIVMGGGIGISVYAKHRIVTERTRMAMPEMNIGYFPDVGASYFLNKAPGQMGKYMAVSAKTFSGSDAIYLGLADVYMQSGKWDQLKKGILSRNWGPLSTVETSACLSSLIDSFAEVAPPPSQVSQVQDKVDHYFSHDSICKILDSLKEGVKEGDIWADETFSLLNGKSPNSLALALEQLKRGKGKTLGECLRMELDMDMQIIHTHDFYEGIRSVLVDKDRNPKWNPAHIKEITHTWIDTFFISPWSREHHPLKDLV